jgi:mRNA interferase MazF
MPRRGDIVLIPFPFTDLTGEKIRPALVLSKQAKGNDIIVVFITSKSKQKSKTGATVFVASTETNGIKVPSVIVCDKIATLDKKIVLGQLGRLEAAIQAKVDKTITEVLGL